MGELQTFLDFTFFWSVIVYIFWARLWEKRDKGFEDLGLGLGFRGQGLV